LNLLYRNENLKKLDWAVRRDGTFYLVEGENGAIYGALTFVNI
jgi:hypothetical protein